MCKSSGRPINRHHHLGSLFIKSLFLAMNPLARVSATQIAIKVTSIIVNEMKMRIKS